MEKEEAVSIIEEFTERANAARKDSVRAALLKE